MKAKAKTTAKPSSKAQRSRDPHRDREAGRYENPIPSREFILQILEEEAVPVEEARLAKLLGIKRTEAEGFTRRLGAMERDGQILRNRKGAILVAQKLDLVSGKVEAHPDGFGFLIPDEGGADLFLSPTEMQQVMHGDRVMVRPGGLDRRGRREGNIVEVLERAQQKVVGRLRKEHGLWFLIASDRRIQHDILIEPGTSKDAKEGQVVTVELAVQPGKHTQPIGKVTEVLGNYADPGMEIEIALRKHSLPHEFSAAATRHAAKLPKAVRESDWAGRIDLRDLPLVTIDGETARDFDDAVYCEKQGKGFRLIVAIADVSYYVTPGDALDIDARERGNSVYFPRRVIPMLPEKLSNGLCSINPDEDRLCMVCEVIVSPKGELGPYKFYPAVMRSHARLTYTRVAKLLYGLEADVESVPAALHPRLQVLDEVFRALLQARGKRGAIDFETIETQMIFDDKGKIEKIVPVTRNDAHRLIEECMLAANVCTADFLIKNEQPALYRVHEGPTPEKLERLREFLKSFGFHLEGGEKPTAKHYAKLLTQIKERPDKQLLQTVLLRSLQQAVYSPDNEGHFGLAYEAYTHFTSPIRRYPDLLIHRAIKGVLTGERYKPGKWHELGVHCSMTERRADDATRDVVAWLKCYYMQDKINEEFDGSISAVTSFGVFVALDDVYVEGLVHVSELGNDYFKFDAALHEMRGERSGRSFRLGDRVRVKVVRVSLETTRIDFVLSEPQ
ncbi:MAG TPA: ribonuclease R [Burkholderiales bacterium]|nr:ribonuclease R [Burkholderiales bacterium]